MDHLKTEPGELQHENISRRGDWMQTYSGRIFYPLDPRPEDIDIEDIAHALSLQCRFNGHCRTFYSVAEHSVRVSELLPREFALWGLLHDAAETYLGDLVRPIKRQAEFSHYREHERVIEAAVATKFALYPTEIPRQVRHADDVLLATERRDLLGSNPAPWESLPPPLPATIEPLVSPSAAEAAFLWRFCELTGETLARCFNSNRQDS